MESFEDDASEPATDEAKEMKSEHQPAEIKDEIDENLDESGFRGPLLQAKQQQRVLPERKRILTGN